MNPFRPSSKIRLLVVGGILLAWLALTNHCALGLMRPTGAASDAHRCCQAGQPPQPEKAPVPGHTECCQAVHAVPPDGLAWRAAPVSVPPHGPVFFQPSRTEPYAAAPIERIFDHGPLAVFSFAENVLQESLPSHAPPRLA